MKGARFQDIARRAGVGMATVDRVLNNRGGVRLETARRVLEAARHLGVNRTLPALYERPLRLDVIMPRSNLPFYRRLGAAFRDAASLIGHRMVVQQTFLDEQDAVRIARRIDDDCAAFDGIVVVSGDHEPVRAAITRATDAHRVVVTLVTDLPSSPRLAYVGIDNLQAGRTAGYFLGWMLREVGAVVVICGESENQGQMQRLSGFRQVLGERFPGIRLVDVLVGHEQPEVIRRLAADAMQRHGDIGGIYNVAGAVAAVVSAFQRKGDRSRMFHVVHELSDDSRCLMAEGLVHLVIDQNPERQAMRVIENLASSFGLIDKAVDQQPIPFTVHGPENIG